MSDREQTGRASNLGQQLLALLEEHWPDDAEFQFLDLLELWLGGGGSLLDLQQAVRHLEARGQIVETSLWGTSWRRAGAPDGSSHGSPAAITADTESEPLLL